MKKNVRSVWAVCAFVFMLSCTGSEVKKSKTGNLPERNFKIVKINNEYSVHVPKYMKETDDLNDKASLQYENIYKETYLIVVDEDKQHFIDLSKELGLFNDSVSVTENYQWVHELNINQEVDILKKTETQAISVHDLDTRIMQIDGRVSGTPEDVSFFFAFIEGDKKMYYITAWTTPDKKETYTPDFMNIIKSFRLINKK